MSKGLPSKLREANEPVEKVVTERGPAIAETITQGLNLHALGQLVGRITAGEPGL